MRIGIDARMYGPKISGIGNYVKNLIDNLLIIDKENEYIIFLLKEDFENFSISQKNIKKVLLNVRWYSLKEQMILWRKIEKEKIDVMHFPNFNVPLFYTENFVVTIHDMTPWRFPGPKVKKSKTRSYFYKVVFDSTIKRSDKIITVSHHSRREIEEKYPQFGYKIEVVSIGMGQTFQKCEDYVIIEELKKKYNIVKPYIFFIGVWRDHKNIPGLLHAFEILKTKHILDIQLVLAGDNRSPDGKIIKTLDEISSRQDVKSIGFVSEKELEILYSGALVTVIPSFNEGFGMHALESVSCGTPVVSSNTTSLPEVMGDGALYFDPYNHQEMADVIMKIINNKALGQKLVGRAREIMKRYSWEKCARQTLEIYKKSFNPPKARES